MVMVCMISKLGLKSWKASERSKLVDASHSKFSIRGLALWVEVSTRNI